MSPPRAVVGAGLGALLLVAPSAEAAPVRVGSKAFTESVVLGEIVTQSCASTGAAVVHERQLGGSPVLFRALEAGEIDVYPEYTGTLAAELLHLPPSATTAELGEALHARGLEASRPLGFENTYALGVRASQAKALGLRDIADLAPRTELVFGLSHELVARADGWPGLRARYGLRPAELRAMDHDVAYKAIAAGSIDVMDLYTTDAEIPALGLEVLEDGAGYFPPYHAVLLWRRELVASEAACVDALRRLEGRIDAPSMRAMNAAVKLEGETEAHAASRFLERSLGLRVTTAAPGLAERISARTLEHLALTIGSVLASALVGLPLGVAAARHARLRSFVLGAAGVVQTIPSLALLVLMIPLLGIGTAPALAALLLYALFPIVEGAVVGLSTIPTALRESAEALGLSARSRLLRVELPIASPSIVSGLRTASVLSVGTATIGAMVGAGGYGQPILTGVRLDSVPTILEGALPAAALALLVQLLFRMVERAFVPRGVSRRDA